MPLDVLIAGYSGAVNAQVARQVTQVVGEAISRARRGRVQPLPPGRPPDPGVLRGVAARAARFTLGALVIGAVFESWRRVLEPEPRRIRNPPRRVTGTSLEPTFPRLWRFPLIRWPEEREPLRAPVQRPVGRPLGLPHAAPLPVAPRPGTRPRARPQARPGPLPGQPLPQVAPRLPIAAPGASPSPRLPLTPFGGAPVGFAQPVGSPTPFSDPAPLPGAPPAGRPRERECVDTLERTRRRKPKERCRVCVKFRKVRSCPPSR